MKKTFIFTLTLLTLSFNSFSMLPGDYSEEEENTPPQQTSIEQQAVNKAESVETKTKRKQGPWKLKRVSSRARMSHTEILTTEEEEKVISAIKKANTVIRNMEKANKTGQALIVHCTQNPKDLKGILRSKGTSKKKLNVRWKKTHEVKIF